MARDMVRTLPRELVPAQSVTRAQEEQLVHPMNPMDQAERGHPQNLLEKHPIESSMERPEVKDLWQVVAAVQKSFFVKAK